MENFRERVSQVFQEEYDAGSASERTYSDFMRSVFERLSEMSAEEALEAKKRRAPFISLAFAIRPIGTLFSYSARNLGSCPLNIPPGVRVLTLTPFLAQ